MKEEALERAESRILAGWHGKQMRGTARIRSREPWNQSTCCFRYSKSLCGEVVWSEGVDTERCGRLERKAKNMEISVHV